jgi:hypothetical protein
MNHPYVPGAVLVPNTPYTQHIPCGRGSNGWHEYDVSVEPQQVITVIATRRHEIDRMMWYVTAIFPDGGVHTGLMFKDDFVAA